MRPGHGLFTSTGPRRTPAFGPFRSFHSVRHLPNLISLLRIALVWPVAAALEAQQHLTALALFMLAGVSDGVDGFLAKRFNWTSDLGKILDPLADKLLLVTVFVEASWLGLTPWWLTAAVVARDVFISAGALGFRLWFGALHGRPTVASKLNTATQLLYLLLVMVNSWLHFPPARVLGVLAVIAFITTLFSGLNYLAIFAKRAWAQPLNRHT
jgi:cardiolipin synthase (CMP-forming)